MTPDTPTTATAAMSELLQKNPRPWSVWVSPNARQLVDATNAPISLNDLCAAVNATGTGDGEEYDKLARIKELEDVVASANELLKERESALAAARDELTAARLLHDKMVGELDAAREQIKGLWESIARDSEQLRETCRQRDEARKQLAKTDKCPSCGGTGPVCYDKFHHDSTPSQPTPDVGEKQPPAHAFEVRISIGGEDWDYVVRTLDELSKHIPEHGPTCGLCSGGAGGSHSVTIHQRDVTPEQYHVELQQWLKGHRALKLSALRAAGGGGGR